MISDGTTEVILPLFWSIVFLIVIVVLPTYLYLYNSGNSLNILKYFRDVKERGSISRELKVELKRISIQAETKLLERLKKEQIQEGLK